MTDEHEVQPSELQEISSRLRFRQWVGTIAGLVLIVWMVVFALLVNALISTTNHTVALATRSDCKTQYTSVLAGPVQVRDNLNAQVNSLSADLNSQLGQALLGVELGQRPTSAVVAQYASTKAQLDLRRLQLAAAIDAVNKEPTLNAATTKGFRFQGRYYPACPVA